MQWYHLLILGNFIGIEVLFIEKYMVSTINYQLGQQKMKWAQTK